MKQGKTQKPRPQRLNGGILPLIAGVGSVAGAVLSRRLQGQKDAGGLLPRDCGTYGALWALTLATVLALAVCAWFVGNERSLDRNYPGKKRPGLGLTLAGAAAAVSGALGLLETGDGLHKAACVLGLGAGIGLLAWGIAWLRGREPRGLAVLLPGFWLAASLVDQFRGWSQDPQIADYCFRLLASVWAMLGAYYLAGFPLEQGRRRRSLFFAWSGAFLCILGIAGSTGGERLQYAACAIWLIGGGPSLNIGKFAQKKGPDENMAEAD